MPTTEVGKRRGRLVSATTLLLHQRSLPKSEAHREEEMEVSDGERAGCEDILGGPAGASVFSLAWVSWRFKGSLGSQHQALHLVLGCAPLVILLSFFM